MEAVRTPTVQAIRRRRLREIVGVQQHRAPAFRGGLLRPT